MRIARGTSIAVFLAVSVATADAQAADPAEALIAQGVEYRRTREYDKALEAFQKAHALAPSPRTLGQMALVEHDLRRWLEADQHLTAALASPEHPWIVRSRKYLVEVHEAVRRHIGEVVVTGPPGAKVSVDGRAVGELPLARPVRVTEGEATVEITAPDFLPFTQKVIVAGGRKVTVEADLVPDRRSLPMPAVLEREEMPMPRDDINAAASGQRRPWTAIGLIAVGVAAVVTGGVLVAMDGKGACTPAPGGVCPRLYDTKVLGTVVAAAGLGAGVTGGLLLFRSPKGRIDVALLPVGLGGRF